jgi:hypothetical protein
MIDGLKLTLSGEELRTRLEERIRCHERRARRWMRDRERTEADATEEEPLLPDQICKHEAERHTWRADLLTFIRDHIDAAEAYRLGAADLEYAEVLPEKPDSVEQEEYEERQDLAGQRRDGPVPFARDMDDYRITRLDIEGGPEIIRIEQK